LETTLLLAMDHRIVRDALRALLEAREGLCVLGEAGNGREALELAEQLKPDIVLMDSALPRLSALEVTRRVSRSECGSKILILATSESGDLLEELLRAGASGCLLKSSEAAELFTAIDVLRRGQVYLSPGIAQQVLEGLVRGAPDPAQQRSRLTAREREVLELVAEGLTSKEIAVKLSLSTKTIESHRAALMRKLGIHKVSGLVHFAIRKGWVAPVVLLGALLGAP
jgi:DNA-binding NarL/FixJ family response regulator